MTSSNPPLGQFEVEDALSKLTIQEKIALVSGIDFWHTAPVHRLGIPSIRLTDGPNGVRGTRFFLGIPAACLPCGTGLAATWDTELIKKGGALQGEESKAKGASVILGPTTNMQRSPLGGRGFESFSEDPYLAGAMSAATINGIQSTGVGATIKHFTTNDQEHERMSVDSIVSERALREIYLMPFQIAQRDSSPWCYMTAYNRLNGVHLSESKKILEDTLRAEWGFKGLVMSDWFGTYSTTESIKAGLDLEMPGPSYVRGTQITNALNCQKLKTKDLDKCVRRVLELVKKVQPLGIEEGQKESTKDTPETAALLRKIAGASIVLLKNEGNILPFKPEKTTAIIGPNAAIASYCGGGSASLPAYYAISPKEGIEAKAKTTKFALGAPGWKKTPLLTHLSKTPSGEAGMSLKFSLEPATKDNKTFFDELTIPKSDVFLVDYYNKAVPKSNIFYAVAEASFTPTETSEYEFSLSVAGTGKLFIDDKLVIDNATNQTPGDSFFNTGTIEELGRINLTADKTYTVRLEFGTFPTSPTLNTGASISPGGSGFRIGCERVIDIARERARAVELAKSVDQVVLCMGLNSDWESESYDRSDMHLPPGSDELIKAVTAANPNTAVVLQSGTPVTMPWLSTTPAVLQAWYGGNETGNAIADVLFGTTNPSGKTSLSFPVHNEDNPAFLNFRSERGRAVYGEDVYVGYRFYEKTKRAVNFPFGHGLSYTSFTLDKMRVDSSDGSDEVRVELEVCNTGKIAGAEVVQVYVSQRKPSLARPVKELKGFSKVELAPGEKKVVAVKLSKKYATSFWDEGEDSWVSERDTFDVLVGNSSADVKKAGEIVVPETVYWRGL